MPGSVYILACWSSCMKMREHALQEMQQGKRTASGTLAAAASMPPHEQRAVVHLHDRA